MIILKILTYPDKRLRIISKPILNINNNLKKIINSMFETMYKNNGIGLASNQVNIHKQIIVIDISKKKNKRLILINPKIIKKTGLIRVKEGCLSIPNKYKYINRSKKIKLYTMNLNGNFIKIKAKNLLSICIQHEIDHLNGKLLIDY